MVKYLLGRDLISKERHNPADTVLLIVHFMSVINLLTTFSFAIFQGFKEGLNQPLLFFFSAMVFGSILILLRTNYFNWGKLLFLVASDLFIVYLSCALGPESHVQIIFIVLFSLPFFIFNTTQKTFRTFSIVLVIGAYASLEYYDYQFFDKIWVKPQMYVQIKWTVLLLGITINFLIMYLFSENIEEARNFFKSNQKNKLALFDAIPDMMLRISSSGTFLDYKAGNFQPYANAKNIIGQNITDGPMPKDLKVLFLRSIKKAIDKNEIVNIEYMLNHGRRKSFYEARIVKSSENEVISTVRDITANKRKEKELQEAQNLAKLGYWMYDIQYGLLINWSEDTFRQFGLTISDNIPNFNEFSGLIHPDDRPLFKNAFDNSIQNKCGFDIEIRVIHNDLKVLWINLKCTARLDEDGNLESFQGTSQEITERKEAIQQIQENKNLVEKINNTTPTIIFIFNLNKSKITYANRNLFQDLGYDDKKLDSVNNSFISSIVHPDDLIHLQNDLDEVHDLKEGEVLERELRIQDVNGQYNWYYSNSTIFSRNQDNGVNEILYTFIDVTIQKRAEERLRFLSERQSLINDVLKVEIRDTDLSDALSHALKLFIQNPSFTKHPSAAIYLLDEDDELILRSTIISPESSCYFKTNIIHDSLVGEELEIDGEEFNNIIDVKNDIRLKDNCLSKIDLYDERIYLGSVFFYFNEPYYHDLSDIAFYNSFAGSLANIIKQFDYEQSLISAKNLAEKASTVKAQFLSTMSHEIRTPMNAVVGVSHLLLNNNPNPEQVENLNTLKSASDNLLALINDILDFSKIEAGKIELEYSTFDFKDFIESTSKTLGFLVKEKGLEFKLNYDNNIPSVIRSDKTRLTQILTNLLGNAAKFTNNGFVEFNISLQEKEKKSALIDFEIKDSGIGIPKEKQHSIFESFSQANMNITRTYGGTGLGLAITKKLLELFHSSIAVRSKEGVGTSFFFSLSLDISETSTLKKKSSLVTNEMYEKMDGAQVLIVDDNPLNTLIARQFLEQNKMIIDEAVNGEDALEKIQASDYDLVLMDLQMPIMDGIECTKRVRQLNDIKYKKLPIVALTASVLSDVLDNLVHQGFDDYATKPFVPNELFFKIGTQLLKT